MPAPRPIDDWSTASEAALLVRARSDPDAFAELYNRHLPRVFHFLLVHCADADDAADLTLHVFLRAWENFPRYEDRGAPFIAWLMRIAHNAGTDMYRRRARPLTWHHLSDADYPLALPDPEAVTLRMESLNQLRIAIGQFDPKKQALLALRFAAGLNVAEIAVVIDKNEYAVRKLLARTMRELEGWYRAGED